jgi:hypothetical protein
LELPSTKKRSSVMQRHLDYFTHFSAVGFPISSQIEFERLLKMAFESGQAVPLHNGKYVVWEPGEGVQLWVKVKDRAVLGCAPHYRGEGTLQVNVQGFYSRPEDIAVTDGALLGTGLPIDAASASFSLVADVPGFEAAASRIAPPRTVTVQLAAFAREMNCFPDSSSFARWQRTQNDIPDPESLLFPALAPPRSAPSAGGLVPAEALITARVLKAQMRVNPITQQNFIALVAAAPGGGTIDIAANPQAASGELTAGGIIHGAFWLSGAVHDTTTSSDAPERSAQAISPLLSRLTGWVRGGS